MGYIGNSPTPVVLLPTLGAAGYTLVGGAISTSRAGSAETISVVTASGATPSSSSQVGLVLRDPTVTTGSPDVQLLQSALTLTIPSTALMGATSAVPFRLWLVVFQDAGTLRLGAINCLSGVNIYPLAGFGIASSTTIDTASDNAQVFYTGTGVTSKAYVVIGYVDYTLATAGTWGTAPARLQMFGPGVLLPGTPVQVQRTATGAVNSGATAIPFDDTIPQSTEGDQYMTQAITPTAAANLLVVRSRALLSHSAASFNIVSAVFRDAGTDALVSVNMQATASTALAAAHVDVSVLAGSTAATTFKYRAGSPAGATTTFNGSAAARNFGGTLNSFMEVTEVMA